MQFISEFLASHGAMLLVGATALMAIGSVAVSFERSPIHRQRLGEFTIAGVLVWLVLTCLPMPRFLASTWPARTSMAAEDTAHSVESAVQANSASLGAPSAALRLQPEDEKVLRQVYKRPARSMSESPKRTHDKSAQPSESAALGDPREEELNPSAVELADRPTATALIRASVAASIEALVSALPTVFLIGLCGCLTWLLLGQVLLWRIRASTLPVAEWLTTLFESLPGVDVRRTRLIISPRCGRAMTWGAWRPTIALPAELCQPANAAQLRHVLLHELGHVVQRDARSTLLFNLAFPLLYFHPLYWWLRSRARLAGELIADDWAAGHSTPAIYAGELIQLASTRRAAGRERLCCLGTTGIFQTPTQFYRRMHMLLDRQNRLATACTRTWRLAHALIACLVIGVATASVGVQPAGAQSPPNDAKLRQLQAERDDLQKQVADLQAKLNDLSAATKSQGEKPIDSDRAGTWPSLAADGVIEEVAPDKKLVTVSLGSDMGMATGGAIYVHRQKPQPKFIGTVELIKVEAAKSVGRPVNLYDEIQVGDLVTVAFTDWAPGTRPSANASEVAARLWQARADFAKMRTGAPINKATVAAGQKALADLHAYMKKNGRSTDEMLAEVYFLVLQRRPTDDELAAGREQFNQRPDTAYDELVWKLLKAGIAERGSPLGILGQGPGKADPNAKGNKSATPEGDQVFEAPTVTVLDNGRGIEVHADEKKIAAFDSATGKVIWASELNRPVKPPLKIMVTGDNVTVLDNDSRVIVIDQKTGKVIAETRTGGDPMAARKTKKNADADAAAKALYAETLRTANYAFQNPVASRYGDQKDAANTPAATTGELDLISLATAYADAVGNVEIAKVRIEQAEKRVKETPGAGEEDLLIGRINLKTADRKVAVLHAIAEEALRAALREMESTKSPDRQPELSSRAAVLKTILQVDSTGTPDKPAK